MFPYWFGNFVPSFMEDAHDLSGSVVISWGWRIWCEGVEQHRLLLYICVSVCPSVCVRENTCLMSLCVCVRMSESHFCFLFVWMSGPVSVPNTRPSRCAVWGMPVGWPLLTWPTPRGSRSAQRFSPMPRTSNKTWPSPITGLFWTVWPRSGAKLVPPSRDAASRTACPTERGRLMAWKRTRGRRPDRTVGH